jgi:outer membrane immunogenic protein
MRRRFAIGASCVLAILAGANAATAQTWKGAYVAGFVGGARPAEHPAESVGFDTNLDGAFGDTVRTAAGANAFSPGFCGGLAVNATAAAGCVMDESGVDFGGRAGYDWQFGRFVLGGLAAFSRADVADSVTAFSTTPAFYAFTRESNYTLGLRARAGIATDRFLAYGTLGPAWSSVDQAFTTSNSVNTFVPVNQDDDEGRESVWGYQAGAGLEFRLGGPVTVFGEYLFSSFDNRESSTIRSQGPAPATNPFILVNPAGTEFRRVNRLETHSVGAGVALRF